MSNISKLVFVSHPMRGEHPTSAERKADIVSLHSVLTQLRRVGALAMAPYRLHSELLESNQLHDYRVSRIMDTTRKDFVPFHEMHLYGDDVTDSMQGEMKWAEEHSILVVLKLKEPFLTAAAAE